MNTAQDLLRGYVEIYSLPTTFYRINQAIGDPKISMNDLSRMISEDVGVTVRLLKLVNSAFYNFPSRIETVSRAVSIVGTQQLHDLVLSTSVVSMFKGMPPDLVNMDSFWRHGIACGVAARILAKMRHEVNIERYFIGGMLHDIGRLIMYMKRVDLSRSLLQRCQANNELLFKAERSVFGYDHTEVGFQLVKNWNLPRSLQELVLFHHNPGAAKEYPVEASVVHIADMIVHAMRYGSSGERFVPPLNDVAWEIVGLPENSLTIIIDQMEDQVQAAFQTILGENQG
jgi:putative nucleotidyltransferase with HDIG domain